MTDRRTLARRRWVTRPLLALAVFVAIMMWTGYRATFRTDGANSFTREELGMLGWAWWSRETSPAGVVDSGFVIEPWPLVGSIAITLVCAAVIAWCLRFGRDRPGDLNAEKWSREGRCPGCGYDRTALSDDRSCPECGAAPIA